MANKPKVEEITQEAKKVDTDMASGSPNYTWEQTDKDITITIQLNVNLKVKGKDVIVEIEKKHLKVGLKGHPLIIDGDTFKDIRPKTEYSWTILDNVIEISLEKVDKGKWNRVFTTEPELCSKKVEPEPPKLPEKVDSETPESNESTVDDMLKTIDTVGMVKKLEENKKLEEEKKLEEDKKRQEEIEKFKKKYPGIELEKCIFA